MITVTERATTRLQELLIANNAEPEQGVKLVPTDAGTIGMTIDTPREGDEVVSVEQDPLLIVDGSLAEPLDGAQIDCDVAVSDDGQPRREFTVRRPEAK